MTDEEREAETDFIIAMRKEEFRNTPGVVGIMDGMHRGSFIVAHVGTANDGRHGVLLEMWAPDGTMLSEAAGEPVNTIPITDDQILELADMLIGARERVEEARIAKAMAEKPKDVN